MIKWHCLDTDRPFSLRDFVAWLSRKELGVRGDWIMVMILIHLCHAIGKVGQPLHIGGAIYPR